MKTYGKFYNRIFALLVVTVLAAAVLSPQLAMPSYVNAQQTTTEIDEMIDGVLRWKKAKSGGDVTDNLLDSIVDFAGTSPADWYAFAVGRLGITDGQVNYRAMLGKYVSDKYLTADKLDKNKATEWHRISLALLACGGNPLGLGVDGTIDLIADGTYNRVGADGKGMLGRQGINELLWGLIALDSRCYLVPDNAAYTRDDIVRNILSRQLESGGWALSGSQPDVDITAMALTALAPYYNSEKIYEYVDGNNRTSLIKVADAVDKAVQVIGRLQTDEGDYLGFGTPNCESTAQVIVALCSLGKSVYSEEFVKNGKTLLDGLCKYLTVDGGFAHAEINGKYTSDNLASAQALLALTALRLQQINGRRLFDMRDEMSDKLRMQIDSVEERIEALTDTADGKEISDTYALFCNIDSAERSYVTNYRKLSALCINSGVTFEKEEIRYNGGQGSPTPKYVFNDDDMRAVDELPQKLTLQYKATVALLSAKISDSVYFDGKSRYVAKLQLAQETLARIQAEIDDIQNAIRIKLAPVDKLTVSDKSTVTEIAARYEALSDYDKTCVDAEDILQLNKALVRVESLTTAVNVGIALSVVAVALVAFVVWRIVLRKRRSAANKMPESEE